MSQAYDDLMSLCETGCTVHPVTINKKGRGVIQYVKTLEATDENYNKLQSALDVQGVERHVKILTACLCDAEGNCVIQNEDDANRLRDLNLGILTTLGAKAIKVNLGDLIEDDEGN